MHYTVSKLRCLIREVCGMPTSYLEDVLSTARLAHMGQVRRSGEPYIKHPEAVADIVYAYYGDKSLCAAALLHDALEDAPRLGTVETEADMAAMIAGSFTNSDMGNDILMIVRALTHEKNIPYDVYIKSLSKNVPALRVKLSDMLHNLRSSPSNRQKAKYRKSIEMLEDPFGGIPQGISPGHWSELKIASRSTSDTTTESVIRKLVQTYLHLEK